MAGNTFRRPKKEMMLAVNAVLDGNQKEADRLAAEHKLDRKELQARVKLRDGERYTFERRPRSKKDGPTASPRSNDPLGHIDGRTKTVTLLRLAMRVEQLLAERPKAEVSKVRRALSQYEAKRRELAEMESLIGL